MGFEEKVLGMLGNMQATLDSHNQKFGNMQATLDSHNQKFGNMQATLDEHGQILKALMAGQEHLGAEVEGIKVSTTEQFGSINNRLDEFTINFELLRDESWKSKTDIQRIKKTMGM